MALNILGACLLILSAALFAIRIEIIPDIKGKIDKFVERSWYIFSIGNSTASRFIILNCIFITSFIRKKLILVYLISAIAISIASLLFLFKMESKDMAHEVLVEGHFYQYRSVLNKRISENNLILYKDDNLKTCALKNGGQDAEFFADRYIKKFFMVENLFSGINRYLSEYNYIHIYLTVFILIMLNATIGLISINLSFFITNMILFRSLKSRKSILILTTIDIVLAAGIPVLIYAGMNFFAYFTIGAWTNPLIRNVYDFGSFLGIFKYIFVSIIDMNYGPFQDIIFGFDRNYFSLNIDGYAISIYNYIFSSIHDIINSIKKIYNDDIMGISWSVAILNWSTLVSFVFSMTYICFIMICILLRKSRYTGIVITRLLEIAASRNGGAISAISAVVGLLLVRFQK